MRITPLEALFVGLFLGWVLAMGSFMFGTWLYDWSHE